MPKLLDNGMVPGAELGECLGRLGFVHGALLRGKPFLAHLHAFNAVLKPGSCVQLPLFVRMVWTWLRERIQKRRHHPVRRTTTFLGSLFRGDAKAAGKMVRLGE
jgi:hypothetical protein